MFDYEDMKSHKGIWWDVYMIQGMNLGIEWDWQDGWVTINLLLFKVVVCYK